MLAAISYEPLVRIDLGALAVWTHGIFIAVGFLLGVRLLLVQTGHRGIPDDDIYAILSRAGVGGLAGVAVLATSSTTGRRWSGSGCGRAAAAGPVGSSARSLRPLGSFPGVACGSSR